MKKQEAEVILNDKREFLRRPYERTIAFSLNILEFEASKRLELIGSGVDLSQNGVGLLVDYPVESGHVLRFLSGLEQKLGVVQWQKPLVPDLYSIGVQFFPEVHQAVVA